jgi:lipopolysaccharide/colanic/teichoic acid biosynthesis glycosyltransferase
MVEMDIVYARNISIRQDLAIMLRTLPAITVQLLEDRKQTRARSGAGRSAM